MMYSLVVTDKIHFQRIDMPLDFSYKKKPNNEMASTFLMMKCLIEAWQAFMSAALQDALAHIKVY